MPSPRILIVRTSAFGDIVHALPVLTALRRHFRSATIGWVVEESFAPLLNDHPLVDDVIPVRLRAWRKQLGLLATWREIGMFFRHLHDFSAEIVLDLMGNHKAGAISALSFSDRRLGPASSDRRERSSAIWISEAVTARGEHAADRMLSLLDGLGIPNEPADFAGHLLAEQHCESIDGDKRFILLHPATGWANKDYPTDRWAAVARQIASPAVKILVAPGPGEEECARQIATLAPGAVETLDPPSLPELVFLQRRASLVIGGDTGPIHLAHALGTPVLCVMGPTDPLRNGPYDAAESVVAHPLPCSFCHKKLDGPRACLLEIDPAIVADQVLDRLCCKPH